MNSKLIDNALSYIEDLFRSDSGGHDAEHTLRVYRTAMLIAAREPSADKETVALAALLHDADDPKLFQTTDNENARFFLKNHHVSPDKIERICEAVNSVSFSRNKGKAPLTIEGKIVRDADRLDALGAIGIARTFAYGGKHGRPMCESVKHFHDKLLVLKENMQTETGKQLALARHAFLEEFLEELEAELNEKP